MAPALGSGPTCRTCGAANAPDARWCGTCGQRLADRRRDWPSRPGRWLAVLAGVLVGGALAIGLVVWGRSGGTDGGGGGVVEVPTPGTGDIGGDARPRPTLSWSRPRAPDAPVHATSGHVIVGPPQGGVAWFDRVDGRGGGARSGGDGWHVLTTTEDAVVLAVEDRELVVVEFSGTDTTVDHLGELTDLGRPLSGTDHVLRRAFLTSDDLYVLAGTSLRAFDPNDARADSIPERWRFDRQHVLSAGTTGAGPYVVVVDGVVALDPVTGSRRWRRDLITFDNRPHRVVDGAIVIGDDDGNVTALDAATGDVRWQVSSGEALAQELVVVDDLLLAAYAGGEVVAYRVTDGSVVWRFERPGARYELVLGSDDVVVLAVPAGRGTTIRAVDASTGRDLWERPVGRLRDVLIDAGSVLVAADRTVTAFEARSGDERWVLEAGSPTRLVDADGDVVVATEARVLRVLPPAGSASDD